MADFDPANAVPGKPARRSKPLHTNSGQPQPITWRPSSNRIGMYTAHHYCANCGQKRRYCRCPKENA